MGRQHGDIGGDIPWAAGALIVAGGIVAAFLRFAYDMIAHQYRAR